MSPSDAAAGTGIHPAPGTSPLLWPLLLILAGSGCAALIYEIVWFQLLQLVIGSSAVSLGLLLASYMGGLCLGAAALPRLVARHHNPLRVYAVLELGIAVLAIAALYGLPAITRAVASSGGAGMAGLIARGFLAAACLLPPTFLMGASFPAIARWAESQPRATSAVGLLYSANIAGAVAGCVMAGFYLLRLYDMAVATYAAAGIDVVVALAALAMAPSVRGAAGAATPSAPVRRAKGVSLVYLAAALSGLTALGAEVVWTRLMSLMLGATVYTFSIILAVFMFGLWAGSGLGSILLRRFPFPRRALAASQLLLALAIAASAYTLSHVLPYWPVDPWLSTDPWFTFDLDVMRCLRAILPATLLWGASFPLALASAAAEGEDPARLSGEVYAANTAGSIVGALVFSLELVPAIGTRGSQQWLIGIAAAGAALALASHVVALPAAARRPRAAPAVGWLVVIGLAGAGTWWLVSTVATVPWQVIAHGRRVAPVLRGVDASSQATPLFVGEGINSSVVWTERAGQRFFYVSGKVEASSDLLDMRLERMMGHVPALLHPQPKSVLVVGFGAGVTAGSFVPNPDVESITICEIEPLIPPSSDRFFGPQNYNVLRNPRTHVVYDDARHFVLTTGEKFDVITTDPIHPWVKGTSTLYSREYYEMVRDHLKPGGVAAQWLPLYESDFATIKSEVATFMAVFPEATVWSSYLRGAGYDMVLLGRKSREPISIDLLERRWRDPRYAGVTVSLADVEIRSAAEFLATYSGRGPDLAPWLSDAQVNNDLDMRLQYLAGWGVNSVASPDLYRAILSYRRFPDDLFTGPQESMEALRDVLGRPFRTF